MNEQIPGNDLDLAPAPQKISIHKLMVFLLVAIVVSVLLILSYRAVFSAVMAALILAYLLKPLVSSLMRIGFREKTVLVILSVLVLVIVCSFFVVIIPIVYKQSSIILGLLPNTINVMTNKWLPLVESYLASFGILSLEEIQRHINSINIFGRLETYVQTALASLWQTSTSMIYWIIYVFLVPILTIFIIKDDEALTWHLKRLIPFNLRTYLEQGASQIDTALRTAIKGQMMVAGILVVLYTIGFSLVGLQLGVVIGIVTGICRFVPYLDVIVGSVLATIVMVSDFSGGWPQVLAVGSVIAVVQGIDGAFITPSIIGDRIGLHPVIIIMSVIAFGDWFGFVGVILAVPIVAVLKVLVELGLKLYFDSRFYNEGQR